MSRWTDLPDHAFVVCLPALLLEALSGKAGSRPRPEPEPTAAP